MSYPEDNVALAMANRDLQRLGEDAAARFLEGGGMRILARNWRLRMGELDLVAVDGEALVFVEVKCRRAPAAVEPEVAVDYRKQRQLRKVARAYLAFERPFQQEYRFDVVSVVLDGHRPLVRHIPDAF